MEGSSDSKKAPSYPSFGPACDHCNKPDTSNMTWADGMKNFFSTYYASPRMGPIGYILDSPYSPLRVVREIPSRNWRDAFEDLLALDTGGQMISDAHRKAEDTYAAQYVYDDANASIAASNTYIRKHQKLNNRVAQLAEVAARNDEKDKAAFYDKMRSISEKAMDVLAAHAKDVKSNYEKEIGKSASSLRSHGHWIVSLMTSGALPGWYWREYISADGALMEFGRLNAPSELRANVQITEKELSQHFVDEQPHNFGTALPIPRDRLLAFSQGLLEAPKSKIDPFKSFDPSTSSVLMQAGSTESVKRPDGSTATKVYIRNELVNGNSVETDYTQEPGEIIKEIWNARKSIECLGDFLVAGPQQDPSDMLDEVDQIIDQDFAGYEDESRL
ncbi:MAG: hypothetical protein Q9226_008434 [Calogaya cf. arnoldii]